VASLRKFVAEIQDVVGFEITDDMLLEAISAANRLGEANRRFGELILGCRTLPVRPTTEMLVGSYPAKMSDIPLVIDAMDTLYKEVRDRIDRGVNIVAPDAPRILTTQPLHATDPTLEHRLTEMGIAIVPASFGPPSVEMIAGEKDPYVLMAGRGPVGGISAKIDMIVRSCRETGVDGLLDLYHAGCRTMVGDAIMIKQAVEREVGIPVLLMEWENFDSRIYSQEQYQWLEIFKTMMADRRRG
jgi:benzoyl-CoA reductase/2-hydroxyglutaryl-CoA dehydratase subunit BcrC/BadD/HgdB